MSNDDRFEPIRRRAGSVGFFRRSGRSYLCESAHPTANDRLALQGRDPSPFALLESTAAFLFTTAP